MDQAVEDLDQEVQPLEMASQALLDNQAALTGHLLKSSRSMALALASTLGQELLVKKTICVSSLKVI
jgi:hypothetical protein